MWNDLINTGEVIAFLFMLIILRVRFRQTVLHMVAAIDVDSPPSVHHEPLWR